MADDILTSVDAAIDAGTLNGAVLCATDAEGRFVFDKALGHRILLSGEKVPERTDDVLYLASATKLIATIAALQCVEDGLLTLTGDLSSVLPELASKQIITGFSEDGETPLLEAPTRAITLEMLLTHSSGLSYHMANPDITRWQDKFNPLPEGQRRGVVEAFKYPLAFNPGSSWMYGPGLDFAGLAVARVTGRTLGEHVQKRISEPLGITTTHFFPVTREDLRARMVDLNPSDPNGFGSAVTAGGGFNYRSEGDFGGHGLFASGEDYLKVMRSLLANDGKLLKPATVDDMFQDHLSPEAAAGLHTVLNGPLGMFFRVGSEAGMKAGHGLGGLLTLEDRDGWFGERTLAWGGGQTLTWFIDRKNDLCGLVGLQAVLPLNPDEMEKLKQTFRHDIYRKRAAWQKEQQ